MGKSILGEKIILLANKGYTLLPDRDIYCNTVSRKCFSLNSILETSLLKIKAQMLKPTNPNNVEVYFSKKLSRNKKKQLKEEIIEMVPFGQFKVNKSKRKNAHSQSTQKVREEVIAAK